MREVARSYVRLYKCGCVLDGCMFVDHCDTSADIHKRLWFFSGQVEAIKALPSNSELKDLVRAQEQYSRYYHRVLNHVRPQEYLRHFTDVLRGIYYGEPVLEGVVDHDV